jgi:hypothetical protein
MQAWNRGAISKQKFKPKKYMTTISRLTVGTLVGVAIFSATQTKGNPPLFFDDFESGLGQWTGRGGGANNGMTIPDPLSSGHGNVLEFTALDIGGDMFSKTAFTLSGIVSISFDYLGLPQQGHTSNLGGFLGYSYSLSPQQGGVDNFWLAATDPTYPGIQLQLIDDGTWHHYSVQFGSSAALPFHIMLEQLNGANGLPGQALFDNVALNVVPEPSLAAFGGLAIGAVLLRARARRASVLQRS